MKYPNLSLRELLDESPDGIIAVDSDGSIMFANTTMTDIFGFSVVELADMSVEELIPQQVRPIHIQHRKKYQAKPYIREMGQSMNIYGITKSGQEIPLDIKLSPVGYGANFHVIAVIRDARHIKKMKDQLHEHSERLTRLNEDMKNLVKQLEMKKIELEQLNEEKDEILGMTIHDIRSPLSTILGFTNILHDRMDNSLSDKDKEIIDLIRKQSKYIFQLVQDMLDLASINRKTFSLNVESTDIKRLVEDVVTVERINADMKQIRIVQNHDLGIKDIDIDASRIEQVIRNIIGNAIKFSPYESVITITLSSTASEVCINISDEGPGLGADNFDDLVKPFQKGSAKPTIHEKSIGLGLAIAFNITQLHGGSVKAFDNKEKGATFSIILPYK